MVTLSSTETPPTSEHPSKLAPRHRHIRTKVTRAAQTFRRAGEEDPRPIEGYALLLSAYGVAAGGIVLLARRQRVSLTLPSPIDFALSALAVQHFSRVLTKDSITSVLRSPLVAFEESTGDGEVSEKVVGTGAGHALGELITCPFCIAQWTATALIAGRLFAPRLTDGVIIVGSLARTSDYLQLAYDMLKQLPSTIGN
jgi:hypothetical protein